jgi:hypothetical protein
MRLPQWRHSGRYFCLVHFRDAPVKVGNVVKINQPSPCKNEGCLGIFAMSLVYSLLKLAMVNCLPNAPVSLLTIILLSSSRFLSTLVRSDSSLTGTTFDIIQGTLFVFMLYLFEHTFIIIISSFHYNCTTSPPSLLSSSTCL